jgi:hypothetical protein
MLWLDPFPALFDDGLMSLFSLFATDTGILVVRWGWRGKLKQLTAAFQVERHRTARVACFVRRTNKFAMLVDYSTSAI